MRSVNFEGAGRVLLIMIGTALLAAGVSAIVIVGAMVSQQNPGDPLIGSDRWFLFYMIPVVFISAVIAVLVYSKIIQEKIAFST